HAVDGDGARQRHRETAREVDERCPARRIGDGAAARPETRNGGDVGDAAATQLAHVRAGGPGELEGAAHIRVVDAVPELGGELVQVGEGNADVPGGVIDEDVEAPELLGGRLDGRIDGRGLRLVELHHGGAAPEAFHHPAGLGRAVAVADIADGDITAR